MYLKDPKSSYKAGFFRLGANRSNLDLPPSAAAEGNGGGYKDQD